MNLTCKLPGPDLADLCGRNLLSEGLGACLYMCGCMLLSVVLNIIIQFSSVAQSCPTLCDPMHCSMPGFPVLHYISWSLLKLMSIELVMPSNHLIPYLLLPSLFPSIRVFPMSQFFASGSHSIGVSASASVLPMNIQD